MRSFFTIPRHPFELHQLARNASAKEVASYVDYLQRHKPEVLKSLLSTIDDYGFFPLSKAYFNSDHEEAYSVLIILLEAGADAYARPAEGKLKGGSLLHSLLEYKCLTLIRLLLWYNPDYEGVLDRAGEVTAAKRMERWPEHCKFLPKELLQHAVNETARDAKRVRELKLLAERAEADKNLELAIDYYLKISSTYLKHQEIEKTLPYFSVYDKDIEAKRPFMLSYYQDKADLFKSRAIHCALPIYKQYQELCKTYALKSFHTLEEKREHINHLDRAADLARLLKHPMEAAYYSSEAARMTIELSLMSEASASAEEEWDECVRNPLLGGGL